MRPAVIGLPVPGRLPPDEVTRLRALLAHVDPNNVRTQPREDGGRDGSTDAIEGYLAPVGSESQRVLLLREIYCSSTVSENLSPEAQELSERGMRLGRNGGG